ncbi:MAG TPA: CYTH domain-containing protein [Planctomycetota bacterium]|nr:CYTH domain-containing protein [Planctomycetota bacterium]HRR83025.1 CYTH domain-containing protein [Planctomycetota bacterium]HRT96038.1 CYTH domain-containing protein [Planctomycetota bacterium]
MRELEAKLIVPDEGTFAALANAGRIGRLRVEPRGQRLQQDTYVDTRCLRLFRAGYACRLRHVEHRAFAALKGLGGAAGPLHEREEVELEIDNPSIGALLRMPEPPGSLVRRIAAGEPVVPLFIVVTWRRLAAVSDGPRECFEMALDRARFFGPRGELHLLEVELESLDGDRALLESAAADLRREHGLTASVLSKFERGLRWAGIAAP